LNYLDWCLPLTVPSEISKARLIAHISEEYKNTLTRHSLPEISLYDKCQLTLAEFSVFMEILQRMAEKLTTT
jgi:hypothetical protein